MKHAPLLVCAFSLLTASAATVPTVTPAPERLLPDDTLVVATAPDFSKLREIFSRMPQAQCWKDPAMKPFRDRFVAKWQEEFVQPLERELDIKLGDFAGLFQGQLTLALTRNGWPSADQSMPGLVLLVDAKDKKDALEKDLAAFRKKVAAAGKSLRTEQIRGLEFTVLSLSSNDIPKALRPFAPKPLATHELGEDPDAKPAPRKNEVVLGQAGSLLILANSVSVAESIVARLTGGSAPPLADLAAYQADHLAVFRDAPLYAWVNVKSLVDLLLQQLGNKPENPAAPNPFDLKPEKVLTALGLTGLKSAAFALRNSNDGLMLRAYLGVPESSRQGIFQLLAGVPKETTPPPFVPADAVKFQRWRIDGQKSWATLVKMVNDISPQWMGGINFLLDTASAAGKEKEPGFDVRKNVIENLGDDLISYEKVPKSSSPAESQSAPSVVLVGSPNPDLMAAALRSIFTYLGQQAASPVEEREFLGRKVSSVPLRAMALPFAGGSGNTVPRNLQFVATSGYVAFSTDAALLEEFLRSADGQGKALRDTPGLADAAQRVTGPGCSLFGYENERETTKAVFEALRQVSGSSTNSNVAGAAAILTGSLGLGAAGKSFVEWCDFSLLPPFEKISQYFYFSVYGGSATVDGLTLRMFAPPPPELRAGGR